MANWRASGGSRRERVGAYLLILPTMLGAGVFAIYPIVRSLMLSFTETSGFRGERFVGLEQYATLLGDAEMWRSVLNTLAYMLWGLFGIPVAIVLAALLNRPALRLRNTYRVLFFLPVVTMPVAIGMVWRLLYNTDFGILNQILVGAGLPRVGWLTDAGTVILSIALVAIWASIGHNIILLLAGMQTIPGELYEAAELDGAGPASRFLRVGVPLLTPTIFLVTILSVIGSLQMFDLVFVMIDADSPVRQSAQTIVYYFYDQGFVENDRGYAAAIVAVLLLLTLLVTAAQFSVQRWWVHYE